MSYTVCRCMLQEESRRLGKPARAVSALTFLLSCEVLCAPLAVVRLVNGGRENKVM